MFFTMKQFAEGMADTKHAMVITIVANLINIFFNYLLIFGNFGMPQLGLDGAGYGTLISRISMPLLFIFFFMRKEKFRSFIPLLKTVKASKARVIRLLSVGFPIATQILLEVTAFGLSGIMMGWLGVVPLAAHNIALGLATVSFMIVTGIGSATTIRVSHQYSVKDFAALQMAAKASIHLVLVFMTFAAIMFALFRNLLPMLYTQDSEVIALAAQLLVFVAVFQIFDGLQVTLLSILRGLADVRNAMIYALIAYIIVNLPVSYFFAFELGWGAGGIWLGFVVGLGLAAALFYSRIHKLFNKFDRNYSTSKSK
jgi:MATE family multidrug resistance protein